LTVFATASFKETIFVDCSEFLCPDGDMSFIIFFDLNTA
jgi:hypothetical protein